MFGGNQFLQWSMVMPPSCYGNWQTNRMQWCTEHILDENLLLLDLSLGKRFNVPQDNDPKHKAEISKTSEPLWECSGDAKPNSPNLINWTSLERSENACTDVSIQPEEEWTKLASYRWAKLEALYKKKMLRLFLMSKLDEQSLRQQLWILA